MEATAAPFPLLSLPEDPLNRILDLLGKQEWLNMTALSKTAASLLEFKWRWCSIEEKLDFDWFGLDTHPYPEKMRYIYGTSLPDYIENELKPHLELLSSSDSESSPFIEENKFLNKPQAGNQLFTGLKSLLNNHCSILEAISHPSRLPSIEQVAKPYKATFQALENAIFGRATYASSLAIRISQIMLFNKIRPISQYFPSFLSKVFCISLYRLAEKSAHYGDEEGLENFLTSSFLKFIHPNELNLYYLPTLFLALSRFKSTLKQKQQWIVQLVNHRHLKKINHKMAIRLVPMIQMAIKYEKYQEANDLLDKIIRPIRETLIELDPNEHTNLTTDKIIHAYKDNLYARAHYLMALLNIEQLQAMRKNPLLVLEQFLEVIETNGRETIELLNVAITAFGHKVPAEVWVHKALIHYYYFYYSNQDDPTNPDLLSSIQCIGQGISAYGKEPPAWARQTLIQVIKETACTDALRNSEVIKQIKIEIPFAIWYETALELGDNDEGVNYCINKIMQIANVSPEMSSEISELKQRMLQIRKE